MMKRHNQRFWKIWKNKQSTKCMSLLWLNKKRSRWSQFRIIYSTSNHITLIIYTIWTFSIILDFRKCGEKEEKCFSSQKQLVFSLLKCDRFISFRRDVIAFSHLFQRYCVDFLQNYEMISVRYADLKQRD
jgi:hypothetical protein